MLWSVAGRTGRGRPCDAGRKVGEEAFRNGCAGKQQKSSQPAAFSIMAQPQRNSSNAPAQSRNKPAARPRGATPVQAARCSMATGMRHGRAKFLRYFAKGFRDPLYEEWERGYKWTAHERWRDTLDRATFRQLLKAGKHREIAAQAIAIEARTNLLFSFEKMALRDAVKPLAGARALSQGLFDFLHGKDNMEQRFTRWCEVVEGLPRGGTRVLTWPIVTVFGFIAEPVTHIFLKPLVTRKAADALGLPFEYRSWPNWETYAELLRLSRAVRKALRDLHPREMIDIQSFLWVQGSDEYPDRG